ncbi:MAG: hypothetical protein Q4C36_04520 [Coriobacteriia bacterium]|nr:hypothetical protein [Coriobacteriia bacterium]
MQASENEIQALLQIQEADIIAINAEKKLAELPQRAQLQALAEKKKSVLEKLAQVTKMHDAARRKFTSIEDERAILLRKQEDTQAKIDASSGDFRAVQSLTRDMGGIAKRLSTLEGEFTASKEKLDQVKAVKGQVEGAIQALDEQALRIRDSFQRDAAELKAQAEEARGKSERFAVDVSPAVMKQYANAARRGGGMGIARLIDDRCSTCRNTIDANRMLMVKREAPLSSCPSCGRLLIVS